MTTPSAAGGYRDRLALVLAIRAAILMAEVGAGLLSGSLALLADAGHAFADLGGVTLSIAAIQVAARPPSARRSFGFYRIEILTTVLNALLLLAIAGIVLVEAWRRVSERTSVDTGPVLVVAAAALLANLASTLLLRSGQAASLTVRGAYLEVLGDSLGSAAVLVSALVIAATSFTPADPIASALISLLIVGRIWRLLGEAIDVLLEATPKDIDMEEVRRHILEAPGVVGVHDLHAWTITSGMNVVSAHVRVTPDTRPAEVLDHLCRCLSSTFDIEHSTFQLEPQERVEQAAHL